jgi:(2R)-sulfolactate sulfo-lyase subunit alpha
MGETENDGGGSKVDFLAHAAGDHVAVAVCDVEPGPAVVGWLKVAERRPLEVRELIKSGHKVALVDLGEGDDVVEYGERVAVTRCPVKVGELVHTHNVRSARWQHSA